MKKILLILKAVIGVLATRVDASDWQKDDSDSRCGNRKSFVRDDQLTIIAITADQRLLKFRECNPTRAHQIGSVYGLQASDYRVVGIDFRVQDGQLYGVGNGGGHYTNHNETTQGTTGSPVVGPPHGHLF